MWSADDSKEAGFSYVKQSQDLLARGKLFHSCGFEEEKKVIPCSNCLENFLYQKRNHYEEEIRLNSETSTMGF